MFKIALYLLLTVILATFLLPFFYTVSAYELNPTKILQAPSFEHIFGTDRLGRDIFARILEGGQTSLIIGFLAASISSILGLVIGITAGYFKGNIDKTITILIDLFLTFPTFFLLLALVSYIQASAVILIIVISNINFLFNTKSLGNIAKYLPGFYPSVSTNILVCFLSDQLVQTTEP